MASRSTSRARSRSAAAYAALIAAAQAHAPSARVRGVLVQPMAPPGLEMILGVKRDATFGPLLMVGLGGVDVEHFKDVVLAPVPLTPDAARGLLLRLKGASLLKAYRGSPPRDIDALVDAMVRLAGWRMTLPTRSPRSTSIPSSYTPRAQASPWSMRSWSNSRPEAGGDRHRSP